MVNSNIRRYETMLRIPCCILSMICGPLGKKNQLADCIIPCTTLPQIYTAGFTLSEDGGLQILSELYTKS